MVVIQLKVKIHKKVLLNMLTIRLILIHYVQSIIKATIKLTNLGQLTTLTGFLSDPLPALKGKGSA